MKNTTTYTTHYLIRLERTRKRAFEKVFGGVFFVRSMEKSPGRRHHFTYTTECTPIASQLNSVLRYTDVSAAMKDASYLRRIFKKATDQYGDPLYPDTYEVTVLRVDSTYSAV